MIYQLYYSTIFHLKQLCSTGRRQHKLLKFFLPEAHPWISISYGVPLNLHLYCPETSKLAPGYCSLLQTNARSENAKSGLSNLQHKGITAKNFLGDLKPEPTATQVCTYKHTIKNKTKSCFLFVCYLHSQFYNSNETVWSNALESSRKLKLSLSRITRLCQQRSWSHAQSAGGLPGAEPWATTGCSRPLCCPRLSRALPHRHCHGWTLPGNADTAWMPGGREKHHSRWGWEGEAQLCAESGHTGFQPYQLRAPCCA